MKISEMILVRTKRIVLFQRNCWIQS